MSPHRLDPHSLRQYHWRRFDIVVSVVYLLLVQFFAFLEAIKMRTVMIARIPLGYCHRPFAFRQRTHARQSQWLCCVRMTVGIGFDIIIWIRTNSQLEYVP